MQNLLVFPRLKAFFFDPLLTALSNAGRMARKYPRLFVDLVPGIRICRKSGPEGEGPMTVARSGAPLLHEWYQTCAPIPYVCVCMQRGVNASRCVVKVRLRGHIVHPTPTSCGFHTSKSLKWTPRPP